MHVVITGGAGFIGKKLAAELLRRGSLNGGDADAPAIERLTLFDVVPAAGLPDDPRLNVVTGDISDGATVAGVIGKDVGAVFHLAAIVSSNAEQDFDLGMQVNLGGTSAVLKACRANGNSPRVVFASSCAVYGGDMPEIIGDDTILTPQTSYGAQKAASELLVADYSRKGFIDGRSLRLPTIAVRPGKPNKAASTFASSIFREPLAGLPAVCPVTPDTAMYFLSPRRVVEAFIHAFELSGDAFGMTRGLTLPGISYSMGEAIEALTRVAGEAVAARVSWEPDPMIQKIVSGWPWRFGVTRAAGMGFKADENVEAIIRAHIEDELGGQIA